MTRTRTLTLTLALLLAACTEVQVGSGNTAGAGNPLPPLMGGAGNDDNGDDDASDDDDVADDDDVTDDDDTTPEDEGDDDVADDDASDDDTTPTGDDDDTVGDDDDVADDDDTTPAPTPTGDVSWWYRSEDSVQYDAMWAFGWSWAFQSPGDGDCSDCYVLLNIAANAVTISGGPAEAPELAALPEDTILSFDVIMENDGEGEIWSCQNGAPSGWLRVWWGNAEQTVCTLDWGDGCTREIKMGVYNCNW